MSWTRVHAEGAAGFLARDPAGKHSCLQSLLLGFEVGAKSLRNVPCDSEPSRVASRLGKQFTGKLILEAGQIGADGVGDEGELLLLVIGVAEPAGVADHIDRHTEQSRDIFPLKLARCQEL